MRHFANLANFYTSDEWRGLRLMLMNERVNAEGKIICAECGQPILRACECIGHHIKPITLQNVNDASISLNPDNVELLHIKCHNKRHARFGFKAQKKVYYVYGAPCSGKSSFVNDNRGNSDLVVDIDLIWQALTARELYYKPDALKGAVFAAYNSILDTVKLRLGEWETAWIIEGGAIQRRRADRIKQTGAEGIYINTDKETCLMRLASDEKRAHVREQWAGYIEKWFEEFQPDKNYPPH